MEIWPGGARGRAPLAARRRFSGLRGTLGIIALGAIGRAGARRALGFGMRVLGCSRSPREVAGVERVPLETLLGSAEFQEREDVS